MKKKLLIVAAVLAVGICIVFASQSNIYSKVISSFESPTLYFNGITFDRNATFDNYDASEQDLEKYQNLTKKLVEILIEDIKNLNVKKESKIESSDNIVLGLEDDDNLVYFYDNGKILVEKEGRYYGYSYVPEDLNSILDALQQEITEYNQTAENWYMMVE